MSTTPHALDKEGVRGLAGTFDQAAWVQHHQMKFVVSILLQEAFDASSLLEKKRRLDKRERRTLIGILANFWPLFLKKISEQGKKELPLPLASWPTPFKINQPGFC